jgi:hypothetical protein
LGAGLAIELVQAFRLDFPTILSPLTPLAGAVVGAALVWGLSSLRLRLPPRPALVAGALALGALLAWPASGYLERHAQSKVFATGVTTWMAQQPDDDKPVYSAPLVLGPLAGDRLQRELVPLPRATDCAALRAQARRGYVLLYIGPPDDRGVAALRRCMRRPASFSDAAFRVWAPGR